MEEGRRGKVPPSWECAPSVHTISVGRGGTWGQQGSQCQILKGLMEEILGLDRGMFVDLVMAVKGAPKHGFCLETKHKA